jgi:two-component system phosphate regulon sensor histidine kinase PhoR
VVAAAPSPKLEASSLRRSVTPWRSSLLWRSYLVTFSLIGIAVIIGGWPGALSAMAMGSLLLYWSTRYVVSPLTVITRAAEAMARGSYGERISASELDEAALSNLARALSTLSSDLTERLRSMAQDKDRLETVLAATVQGVIVVDQRRIVTLMNQAAQRLLGVSPDHSVGKPLWEACRSQVLVELALQAVSTNTLQNAELKEAGKTLEVYATPLKGSLGCVLVVRDLTEMRRLENLRRDFVANVSHELKTPLTSIRAYLETLLEGGALTDSLNAERFLRKIEVHVNRLTTLITDLLSLSRIESGEAFNQRTRCNLNELVQGSQQRLGPSAEQKNIALRLQLPAEPVFALGDAEAFHQILDNLVDNAVKYTEPGGTVDIAVRRDGQRVLVDVADTGVGIPPEDLPRIFERFYRVDKARSRELGGTGLGLSIVKHLLQALNGEVQVESAVGKGSKFTVSFTAA